MEQHPEDALDPVEREGLDCFIEVFFRLFFQDGRLDERECKPLVAAFVALGLEGIRERHGDLLERRLLAALDAGGSAGPLTYETALTPDRLRRVLGATDLNRYQEAYQRLQKEQARPGSGVPGYADCLAYFSSLLAKSRLGKGPAPALVPAPPPTPPPAPAAKVSRVPWQERNPAVLEASRRQLWDRAGTILATLRARLAGGGSLGLAFDACRRTPQEQAVFVDGPGPDLADLWFIGDVHGDFLAQEAALGVIQAHSAGTPTIVFLGDTIDRGASSAEALLRIYGLMVDHPERTCLLAGNHDDGLAFDGTRFLSGVHPAEFSLHLNAHPEDQALQDLGRLAVELNRQLPRALFLPDGLLVAHGGFPHPQSFPQLTSRAAFNDPAILRQFAWNRPHPRAKRKFYDASSQDQETGYADFDDFCQLMTATLAFPIHRMVRGHAHEDDRFAVYEAYRTNPILTINTMGHRYPEEWGGDYQRTPCVARWRPGALPEVFRIEVDPDLLRAVCPQPV